MIRFAIAVVTASALSLGATNAPPEPKAESTTSTVSATQQLQTQYAGYNSEEILEEGLADEGLKLEEVEIDPTGIDIDATTSSPHDPFEFSLNLDANSAGGEVTFTDKVDGKSVSETYDIKIDESTVDRTLLTLTDQDTGEKYEYDSTEAASSIAFVIPVAFGAVSVATALYYLAIGAAIVVGGLLALEAGKAISKIIKENNKRSQSKKRDYYPATLANDKVFISARGLTLSAAIKRGNSGKDVWALTQTKAKSLAQTMKGGKKPVGPEIHGGGKRGYMYHYHPYKRSPGMHSFFGSSR